MEGVGSQGKSRKKLGWLKRIPFRKSSAAAESEGSETESNVSTPQVRATHVLRFSHRMTCMPCAVRMH